MPRLLFVFVLMPVALFALIAGCAGGDDDDDPTEEPAEQEAPEEDGDSPTATATTAAEPTATAAETDTSRGPDLPESPLTFPLRNAYAYGPGAYETLQLSDLPAGLQNVRARWYRGGGHLIVVYDGLDLDATGPVCPGNSVFQNERFEHVSNSPTAPGACDGDPDLIIAPADAGVQICDGVVSYITLIPDDTEGFVHATINTYPEGDEWPGVTMNALQDRGALPEIDPAILEC